MLKDHNQLEHPINLYSQRCSKWVSGTINDNFVHPDWPQLQGSERLAGPSVWCFWLCLCGGGCARTVFRFQHCHWDWKKKAGKSFSGKTCELTAVTTRRVSCWLVLFEFMSRHRFSRESSDLVDIRSWYVSLFHLPNGMMTSKCHWFLLAPPVRQSCQVINAVIAPFTLGEKLTNHRTRAFQMVGPHGFKMI